MILVRKPHYLNSFSIQGQGLFYSSGVEHQERDFSVKYDREKSLPNPEGFLKPVKRKDWKELL